MGPGALGLRTLPVPLPPPREAAGEPGRWSVPERRQPAGSECLQQDSSVPGVKYPPGLFTCDALQALAPSSPEQGMLLLAAGVDRAGAVHGAALPTPCSAPRGGSRRVIQNAQEVSLQVSCLYMLRN